MHICRYCHSHNAIIKIVDPHFVDTSGLLEFSCRKCAIEHSIFCPLHQRTNVQFSQSGFRACAQCVDDEARMICMHQLDDLYKAIGQLKKLERCELDDLIEDYCARHGSDYDTVLCWVVAITVMEKDWIVSELIDRMIRNRSTTDLNLYSLDIVRIGLQPQD